MASPSTRSASQSSSTKASGSTFLTLALHAERPRDPPSRHLLDEVDEVLIGRAEARVVERKGRELHVGVADPWMSGAHARLVRSGKHWRLEDRGAKNGSFRNGIRIESTELDDGDVLELGHTFFVLRQGPPEDAAADLPALALETPLLSFCPAARAAFSLLRSGATSMIPALILGETGTGKELAAQALHGLSRRAGAFVPVNCGALPAGLIESELFGHKKGAFSGATTDHVGLVSAADGGTLFLDEIGELPLPAQAALLRVLQEKEVRPIGAVRALSVDVRIAAATHRDLEALAEEGKFRSDLLARVAGLVMTLPPVRQRREDLGLIVRALLTKLAGESELKLSISTARALFLRPWKRNVREIEHWLAAALLVQKGGVVEGREEPQADDRDDDDGAEDQSTWTERDRQRRDRILELLDSHGGNITAAAKELGKAREQVYRWIKRYKIDPEKFRRV